MHFKQGHEHAIFMISSNSALSTLICGCDLEPILPDFPVLAYLLNLWSCEARVSKFFYHVKNIVMSSSVMYSLKLWVLEEHLMNMRTMRIITDSDFRFPSGTGGKKLGRSWESFFLLWMLCCIRTVDLFSSVCFYRTVSPHSHFLARFWSVSYLWYLKHWAHNFSGCNLVRFYPCSLNKSLNNWSYLVSPYWKVNFLPTTWGMKAISCVFGFLSCVRRICYLHHHHFDTCCLIARLNKTENFCQET